MFMVIEEIKVIGNLIREARKKQKLTQEQLASICGVGVRFIREVEKWKETSHIGKVFSVLQMLGITLKIDLNDEEEIWCLAFLIYT